MTPFRVRINHPRKATYKYIQCLTRAGALWIYRHCKYSGVIAWIEIWDHRYDCYVIDATRM